VSAESNPEPIDASLEQSAPSSPEQPDASVTTRLRPSTLVELRAPLHDDGDDADDDESDEQAGDDGNSPFERLDDEDPDGNPDRDPDEDPDGDGPPASEADTEAAKASEAPNADEDASDAGPPKGRRRGRRSRGDEPEVAEVAKRPTTAPGKRVMLVNDEAGDETRVAVLEAGRLESLFMERVGTSTNVGNIYKGRVTNVEPAIQAAFIDFGEGQSGFLHVSDLHPKYFPGSDEKTERVGRKIPRRDRPLMQEALKKGQEVVVQVLKEGIGSKGPTLTSYLSIPGRLLVMMPDMDLVGVSRKVEDEDQRRAMRKILDQLDLPEGFGFILRTAGFDRTKTELARDVAYLKRLWDVMQKRSKTTGAPCLLYSEGDLLIRSIRDLADEHVETIVVDSEDGFRKASAFLQVVAPRSGPKLRFWDRRVQPPLFHAFDVERQIALLHSREVPLPSGGALVIDQTEALVAIDVNSGRSRSARDSETNAYHTNCEAVDEIARQLRLRDLGGVIINDLIDMRSPKHRRDIEDRFRAALKRDRAKTTTLPISDFGVIEMTRQRMRPSVRKTHFMDCPHCRGLGEIQMPDTVAADAVREVEYLLTFAKVRRVELVCSVRVATVLLSHKRRALYELERRTGKRIDVRISEAIAVDRVDLYAYDDRDADVELARLPKPPKPDLEALPEAPPVRHDDDEDDDEDDVGAETGGRRRRRRRRKPAPADTTAMILAGTFADLPDADPDSDEPTIAEELAAEKAEEARRRAEAAKPAAAAASGEGEGDGDGESDREGGRRRRRRRRRRGRGGDGKADETLAALPRTDEPEPVVAPAPVAAPKPPSEPILLHLLAKELGTTSRVLLDRCAAESLDVRSHMTKLTGEQADLIRSWYAPPPPEPKPVASIVAVEETESADAGEREGEGEGEGRRRRRRRRRRRGRGRGGKGGGNGEQPEGQKQPQRQPQQQQREQQEQQRQPQPQRQQPAPAGGEAKPDGEASEGGKGKRRRRKRGRGRDGEGAPSADGGARPAAQQAPTTPPAPKPEAAPAAPKARSLYGGRYRKLTGPVPGGGGDDE
jgi:ribonuclease E